MSLAVDFKLVGDKELERAFATMPDVVQRKLVQFGMVEAAQPVLVTAKQLAPRRTGRLADTLAVKAFSKRGYVGAKVFTATRAKLGIGKSAKGYYPIHQELGSKHNKRRAFLRPATDRNREVVIGRLGSILWRIVREHMEAMKARGIT